MKCCAPKLASGMFPSGKFTVWKKDLTPAEMKEFVEGGDKTIFSFGHHYHSVLKVLETLFGIVIPTQDDPPKFTLKAGDSLVVFQVGNLPALPDGDRSYTRAQALQANFRFTMLDLVNVEEAQY